MWNTNEYNNRTPKNKIQYHKKRACEKKSVNSVFYDYIFTYPAL